MQGSELLPQDKAKFLQKLASSAGNVSKAAQAVKISRSAAYDHKSKDADFSNAWDNVIETVADAMEQEMYRRAVKGVQEPVFYKGQIVGKIRKFSDKLLEFGLKGKRPDIYRDRVDVNNHHSGSLDVNIQATIDQIYNDGNPEPDFIPAIDASEDAPSEPGDDGDDPTSED
jgi:hypothetical protein